MAGKGIVVALCVVAGLRWVLSKRKRIALAPSPPSDPIIGHLRMFPNENLDLFLYELGQKFGSILNLNLLGQNLLVLNSVKPAMELLDQRSGIYSGRPRFPLVEALQGDDITTFLDYGEDFRAHRRIFQQYFAKAKIQTVEHRRLWQKHATVLAKALLGENGDEKWADHLMFYSTALTIEVAFGHNMTSIDDIYMKLASDVCHRAVPAAKPDGGAIAEVFPIFAKLPSWIPGNHAVGVARDAAKYVEEFREYPYADVQAKLAAGEAKPCFLATQIQLLQDGTSEITPTQLKAVATSIFVGGAETTSSTLSSFVAAMVLYPDCQQKAHEEIERVIGSERLPMFDDRAMLPYVEGIVQEVLRWQPVVPMGIPHLCKEDDIYNDYLIPGNTAVIPNIRGMGLDDTVYADPHTFDPSRFLPAPAGRGEPHFASVFGFGRRICPGRHLAEDTVWIAVATILATLTIHRPKDQSGNEYTPDIVFESALTCRPLDFPCIISSRNEIIERALLQADPFNDAL